MVLSMKASRSTRYFLRSSGIEKFMGVDMVPSMLAKSFAGGLQGVKRRLQDGRLQ